MGLAQLSMALLAAAGGALAADLQPIEAKGSKFFYKNGTQFYMKGIAYQLELGGGSGLTRRADATPSKRYIDPLADEEVCKRDVPLLQELGTNVIRTYAIDPKADHKACMQLLQDAGIYVVSDLSEPDLSINRDNAQWNTALFARYTAVIDELAQYSNVIGFFGGNEVSNAKNNTGASAFVKAAVRDTKTYIKNNKKITRWLGVGYAANDDKDIRAEMAAYFNCNNVDEAIDFWGYNIYSWCGQSSMQKSGYDQQVKFFAEYSVPVFFAEYGCNAGGVEKRTFDETTALYSDAMTGTFSGGIVFKYFQEENDYGVVKLSGKKAEKMKNFEALKEKATAARPKTVEMADYKPAGKMSDCPKVAGNWEANKALPPTPNKDLCSCMVKSRACIPKSNLDSSKYGEIFGFICNASPASCAGIKANATTGIYGAYSMCKDEEKLAYVLDAYYHSQKKASDACDFDGSGQIQTVNSDSSCTDSLAKASDLNNQVATATAPVGGGAQATSTSDSFAVHGAPVVRLFAIGDFAVGLYMLVALCIGAGMVAL
ncbi:beta-1,3-glucanosyltransferase [Metarhizium rileyi]|uniref:1,3-beta-glucanosyltransferase n=1 Tax=Metarhizium rileyi (strain RCEF 4871) TaxID=1649241 RepID=A0A167FLR5_METRR|nr:beta-1,3-glucanosyltransferase [Metarhizium rileyi RCEF 4871]TWU78324.1 1,3-beta-glucanosyltransferase gas1 [Metarhizium rileyi]